MSKISVSIIIVNWNGKQYLNNCITSLLNQSFRDFEIIFVDNDSSDYSVEYVKKNFPQIKIIKNDKNLGFAEGNNIGIKNSNGNLIALFNPDAVADKNWLDHLVSVLLSSDKIGAVSGKIFYLGEKYGKDTVFSTWPKISAFTAIPSNFHSNEPVSKVDYLSGAAMVVKRSVLDKIGLLDANYFLYFEETDWCARIIRAGYDLLYVPTAIAWHAVSPLSNSETKIYYMERNRIRFVLKNFDLKYIPLFIFYFLGESSAILLRDLKNRNMKRSKIRIRAIIWNVAHFNKTWKARKDDLLHLKKNFSVVKSYNSSLPLRKIKNK